MDPYYQKDRYYEAQCLTSDLEESWLEDLSSNDDEWTEAMIEYFAQSIIDDELDLFESYTYTFKYYHETSEYGGDWKEHSIEITPIEYIDRIMVKIISMSDGETDEGYVGWIVAIVNEITDYMHKHEESDSKNWLYIVCRDAVESTIVKNEIVRVSKNIIT
jgi:hypothetical protein